MIPANTPAIAGNEEKYALEAIRSGWLSGMGPFVERLEHEFAKFTGRKHAIAVGSGTAALDVAVDVLGIGPGDEVIVPTMTIVSCINQILRARARPVFVDCDPQTFTMDVKQIEELVTPRTKAIMAVHLYGLPVDMDQVLYVARKYGLKVIEDAAQAHGLRYKHQICGSFGDISTFSLYSNKLISAGEGGMVVTDDDALANAARNARHLYHNAVPGRHYIHSRVGWSCRMSNVAAAVGLAQLERSHIAFDRLTRNGRYYTAQLAALADTLQLPLTATPYAENYYWSYPIICHGKAGYTLRMRLLDLGVETRPFFYPLHLQPLMPWFNEQLPVAEYVERHGLLLPTGNGLSFANIDRVVDALEQVLR